MDELIAFGSEVKATGIAGVSGYLVRFTDATQPDLEGDFFTKDTDFDAVVGDRVTLYYHHAMHPTIGLRKLGTAHIKAIDEVGIFIDGELTLRDEYERAIYERLVKTGKTGWSSGTLPHLVEREQIGTAYHVKSWPLGKDASITVTPAAGLITPVMSRKSLEEQLPALKSLLPEALGDSAAKDQPGENHHNHIQLRARAFLTVAKF